MSDGSAPGGAPAPADTGAAPIDTGVQTPNPVRSDPPDQQPEPKPEPEPKKPEPTSRNAIRRAQEKVEADAKASEGKGKQPEGKDKPAEGKDKPAEPKQDERARAQDGKFAPKDGEQRPAEARQPAKDGESQDGQASQRVAAPSRFSNDAKAEWDAAPESVRREVARMERETTAGIERYKAGAEEFERVRDFHEQVTKNGGSLHGTLSEVAALEKALLENPVQGLDMVCRRVGLSLSQVAQHLTGQEVAPQLQQAQAQMHALSQENQRLTAIVRAMHGEHQQRETATATSEIEAFAAGRPRFDELRGTMAGLMRQGLAESLEDAYDMADRLKPGRGASSPPSPAAGSNPAPASSRPAQTRAGTASVAGAPSPGSNPAARQPASSVKEALRRAMAATG